MMGVIFWPKNDDMRNYLKPDGSQRTIVGTDNPYWAWSITRFLKKWTGCFSSAMWNMILSNSSTSLIAWERIISPALFPA